jgi:hypothetical protein
LHNDFDTTTASFAFKIATFERVDLKQKKFVRIAGALRTHKKKKRATVVAQTRKITSAAKVFFVIRTLKKCSTVESGKAKKKTEMHAP